VKVRLSRSQPIATAYIHPRHGPWISVTVVTLGEYANGFGHRVDSGIPVGEQRIIYLEYRRLETGEIKVNLETAFPHVLASIGTGEMEGTILILPRKRSLP